MAYPKKAVVTKDELEEMYSKKFLTVKEIALRLKVHASSIYVLLEKYSIQRRPRNHITLWLTKELLTDMYCNKNISIASIAKKLGFSASLIYSKMLFLEIPIRKHIDAVVSGCEHPNWNGGRPYIGANGYRVIPLGRNKKQYEHRLVIEKHIGRNLLSHEIVHHINGNKLDNRIENLKITDAISHLKNDNFKLKTYLDLKKSFKKLLQENNSLRNQLEKTTFELNILKEGI